MFYKLEVIRNHVEDQLINGNVDGKGLHDFLRACPPACAFTVLELFTVFKSKASGVLESFLKNCEYKCKPSPIFAVIPDCISQYWERCFQFTQLQLRRKIQCEIKHQAYCTADFVYIYKLSIVRAVSSSFSNLKLFATCKIHRIPFHIFVLSFSCLLKKIYTVSSHFAGHIIIQCILNFSQDVTTQSLLLQPNTLVTCLFSFCAYARLFFSRRTYLDFITSVHNGRLVQSRVWLSFDIAYIGFEVNASSAV